MTWTPAREEKLRELWPTHSATQIAREIFSEAERKRMSAGGRNAVIGKVHRMKLPAKVERREPRHPRDKPFTRRGR